jgi:hypothetical protein
MCWRQRALHRRQRRAGRRGEHTYLAADDDKYVDPDALVLGE